MGRESIVEIPQGSGNHYRYTYDEGQTKYLGPVGTAPALTEEEFLAAKQADKPMRIDGAWNQLSEEEDVVRSR
jgi:hypothetical protein